MKKPIYDPVEIAIKAADGIAFVSFEYRDDWIGYVEFLINEEIEFLIWAEGEK